MFWEDIKEVVCPAIVIKGGKSDYPKEDLKLMANMFTKGKYNEICDAYHVIHHDCPKDWLECVLEFLKEPF